MTANPSFERTHNGMAPWPRSAAAYHALRGQGATPLRAAQLQRRHHETRDVPLLGRIPVLNDREVRR
jgi:hypothetical protein